MESQLSRLAGLLAPDLDKAEQVLKSVNDDIPMEIHQDLASIYEELPRNFSAVFDMCAERNYILIEAMETLKVSVLDELKLSVTQYMRAC